MSNALDIIWKPSSEAVANTVGDETVILHLGNSTYFGLDRVGAVIWQGLEARQSPALIRETILGEFDVDHDTATRDVAAFLLHLEENGLIERDPQAA